MLNAHNQPQICLLKQKYLTETCKLLTGSFPTFPCEKPFCKLTLEEKPVLLYFKKRCKENKKFLIMYSFLNSF
jgi:hypothetical protein